MESEKILDIVEVSKYVNLSIRKIYSLAHEDKGFPKPIKIGCRRNGWLLSEINAWIDAQAANR